MAGKPTQSGPGTSRTAAAVMLRRGREVWLRPAVESREAVRLAPVRNAAAEVKAGDVVLARTGLRSQGPGALALERVTGIRADVARLEPGGWVLLENIFGKVVSSG
jgi:hypothetical protein